MAQQYIKYNIHMFLENIIKNIQNLKENIKIVEICCQNMTQIISSIFFYKS